MYLSQIWIANFPSLFLFLQCHFLGVGIHEALAPDSEHQLLNGQELYGTHLFQLVGFLRKPAARVCFIWSNLGKESHCHCCCHRWCWRLFKHHRATPLKALLTERGRAFSWAAHWLTKSLDSLRAISSALPQTCCLVCVKQHLLWWVQNDLSVHLFYRVDIQMSLQVDN